MVFRKANENEIDAVAKIYAEVHEAEAKGITKTGWLRDVYPLRPTAQNAFDKDWLFVAENDGKVVATAIINQYQGPIYEEATWEHEAADDEVMVLHTLAVSPSAIKKGIGTAFVKFYEQYALEHNCRELRMDTNANNTIARKLYKKLGYKEVSIVPCVFNGIPGVNLVCLEKYL
ncbi:MAG: GNAT family N-acetyltransferase [Oscillospiraceae bacterium]|nr:GNAT family N-acetyltransferase [Oscillospiraceae bacterium]MBQ7816781.1 GNAT family N-acetyltransferase [Oscillospiraceae bacterium]